MGFRLAVTSARNAREAVGERTLTPLMRETLELVAQGHTNTEIGEILHYSMEGVKDHVKRLLAYYDARNRTHLVTRAFQKGDLKVTP